MTQRRNNSKGFCMISQPMRDIPIEQILDTRDEAKHKIIKMGYDFKNSFLGHVDIQDYVNESLYCLGRSLEILAECKACYFVKGWQKSRGCRIEREACKQYGIKIIDEK